MNSAFPDAEVGGFEELIDELELPDLDDRHVLALAIKSESDAIITHNKKDFPKKYLKQFDIEVYDPDRFLSLLNGLSSQVVKMAFENQLKSLKNPPVTRKELIEILIKCGLKSARKVFKWKKKTDDNKA